MSMELKGRSSIADVRVLLSGLFGGIAEGTLICHQDRTLADQVLIQQLQPGSGDGSRRGAVALEVKLDAGAPKAGSQWAGEDSMEPPATGVERKGTVWMESSATAALSRADPISADEYKALLRTLQQDEGLTRLRASPENFVAEVNEVAGGGLAWCRVFRYKDCTIAPNPEQSIEYFDAVATATKVADSPDAPSRYAPMVSSLSLQASVSAAKGDAWLRVVGVVNHAGISFGIVQEYDGGGCLVALRGGELKALFMVEVLMGFSDALYRNSHGMWMNARYKNFRHRFETWQTPDQDSFGPCASAFHTSLKDAFAKMGYPHVGAAVAGQLERVLSGFAENSDAKLFREARESCEAASAALG